MFEEYIADWIINFDKWIDGSVGAFDTWFFAFKAKWDFFWEATLVLAQSVATTIVLIWLLLKD